MAYDVAGVRGLYTSLSDGWTYLNAHDAAQIPERVSSAVARSFRMSSAVAQTESMYGSHMRLSVGRPEGDAFLLDARAAIADLTGVTQDRVLLGPSVPALYMELVAAMRHQFRYNSSVVLSNLDRPQLNQILCRADAEFRCAQVDLATGELSVAQFEELVDGSTRLVSLPAAHAQLGVVVPVRPIVEAVRERSRAWVVVDASAYAPYRLLSFDEWGADVIAVDMAELGGPQVAALVFRDAAMLQRLDTAMLDFPVSPGLAGGVSATVDHYGSLASPGEGRMSRRNRLVHSMSETSDYLEYLREDLYTFLGTLPMVKVFGADPTPAGQIMVDRIPRMTFGLLGVPAALAHQHLIDSGLVVTQSKPCDLLEEMGAAETGGALTVSLSPFNTQADVLLLTRTVASLT